MPIRTTLLHSRAVQAVARALRDGVLVRQPCRDCGTTVKVQGHHPDHTKQLDVIWLCPRHHALEHWRVKREAKEARRVAARAKRLRYRNEADHYSGC